VGVVATISATTLSATACVAPDAPAPPPVAIDAASPSGPANAAPPREQIHEDEPIQPPTQPAAPPEAAATTAQPAVQISMTQKRPKESSAKPAYAKPTPKLYRDEGGWYTGH
jgi:hypothetical protein